MHRLIGALIGSSLAIAVLIIAVGVPVLAPTDDVSPAPAPVAPREVPAAARTTEAPGKATTATAAIPEPVTDIAAATDAAIAAAPEPATASEPPPQALQIPDEMRWHAFWSPFRSRIAANGFVAQLQRVTGLDYRVVNIKPGVYEVAFAYTDDGEIATNLAQISAATGLDVPGS